MSRLTLRCAECDWFADVVTDLPVTRETFDRGGGWDLVEALERGERRHRAETGHAADYPIKVTDGAAGRRVASPA